MSTPSPSKIVVHITNPITGKSVLLTKGMILDIRPNADGSSTIETEFEGEHVVNINHQILKNGFNSLL